MDKIDPLLNKLRKKVNSGKASDEDKENLKKHVNNASKAILNLSEQIFNIEHVKVNNTQKSPLI